MSAFEKGLAHAPEHAAHELAARRHRVQDAARRECSGHLPDADNAEVGVDRDPGELGAKCEQPERRVKRGWIPAPDGFGIGHEVAPHQAAVGLGGAGVVREHYPAAGRDYPARVGAVQRRLAVADSQPDELVAQCDRGVMYGTADHHRAARAHGRRRGWQVGVAELESDIMQIEAETVGCHLGHHGRHPGPELLGGGLHDGGAVGVHASPGALRVHDERDRKSGCGHPGADQPVPVPLRARLRVAPCPAESVRSALVAFPQSVAGPGIAGSGVDVGDVAQP